MNGSRVSFLSLVAYTLFRLSAESWAAPSIAVSPAITSNTCTDPIEVQISGLNTGETVEVNKYLDVNTNGIVDAADWLVQSFRLTDGQATVIGGVTNINIPYDENPTDGAITARLRLQEAGFSQTFVGKYLYRISSPTGGFTAVTNTFTITNTAYDQWFTGQVQCNGTNVPYAGVLVMEDERGPIAEAVTDGSGMYTIQVAPGVYQLGAFKNGYACDMGVATVLALTAGVPITTNVDLIPATQSISGRFVDATNSSIGLPGMGVVAWSSDNLLVLGFTDTNGGFAVPVTASEWGMGVDDQALPFCGCLSFQEQSPIDTTTGNVSGVAIAFPRGTALFYGTVKTDQGQPLAGISLSANDGEQYEGRGTTDTNGNYTIAVLAGAWHVKPGDHNPGYGNCLFSGVNANITDGQAVRINFTASVGTTVSGQVLGDGNPLEGVGIQVGTITFGEEGRWNWNQTYNEETDSDGNYTVLVPPGTNYYARVNLPSGSVWLGQFYSNATDASSATVIAALTNAPATNINFNLQAGAIVSGRVFGDGVPLADTWVQVGLLSMNEFGNWEWQNVNSARTDGNGDYSAVVPADVDYAVQYMTFIDEPWLQQFYSNTTDVASAMVVRPLVGTPATNINFNLQAGAIVSGRVLGDGSPLSGINVQVGTIQFQEGGGWNWKQSYYANWTDSNGDYSLRLPPGTNYYARVSPPNGSVWLEQFYSNATDASSAAVITALTNASATNINFNLQVGAIVSGRVLGGGAPLSGISVQVCTITFHGGGGWDWEQSYWGNDTDSDGNYTVLVPPGTNYYARISPPNGSVWLEQFYSNATDASSAAVITALTNASATNINFNLQQGAVISGRVLGEGSPLENIWVQVGLISTNEWGDWQWQWVNSARTDNNGDYSVLVPPDVDYAVQYMPRDGDSWLRQYYSNATDEASATLVIPTVEESATHINFNLQRDNDVNDNGVPDSWEEEHFGSLGWMSDTSDWDGDGSPDFSEYWAGTNPTNDASFLGIVGSEVDASGAGFVIRWSSVAGKTYCIERASDLVTGFDTTVKAGIDATPTMNTETDTTAGVEGPIFYRVRVETP